MMEYYIPGETPPEPGNYGFWYILKDAQQSSTNLPIRCIGPGTDLKNYLQYLRSHGLSRGQAVKYAAMDTRQGLVAAAAALKELEG